MVSPWKSYSKDIVKILIKLHLFLINIIRKNQNLTVTIYSVDDIKYNDQAIEQIKRHYKYKIYTCTSRIRYNIFVAFLLLHFLYMRELFKYAHFVLNKVIPVQYILLKFVYIRELFKDTQAQRQILLRLGHLFPQFELLQFLDVFVQLKVIQDDRNKEWHHDLQIVSPNIREIVWLDHGFTIVSICLFLMFHKNWASIFFVLQLTKKHRHIEIGLSVCKS